MFRTAGFSPDIRKLHRQDYLWVKIKAKHITGLRYKVQDRKIYLFNETTNFDSIFDCMHNEPIVHRIKTTARRLRKTILNLDNTFKYFDLNDPLKNIPLEMKEFLQYLLLGSTKRISNKNKAKVVAVCHFIINIVTRGHVKTWMCTQIGMTIKSLTSSRKIVDILNRIGVSISYNLVEEIETEMAFKISQKVNYLPDGLIAENPNLCTMAAFDNYDRYVETLDGRNTLHDTNGIVIQNVTESNDTTVASCTTITSHNPLEILCHSNRRRGFDYDNMTDEIESYISSGRKLPALSGIEPMLLPNVNEGANLNNIWMFTFAFDLPCRERWHLFNSRYYTDQNPRQKIAYLPPIHKSPVSNTVVKQTMNIALGIAQECHQKNMVVVYDMAIAIKALKIQAEMSPSPFDDLFIFIGPFHTELSYFKAVGKFISDCGISNLLVQSGLLANGSVNGFLMGKHFNRCKTLHPVVAVSFKALHFRKFLSEKNDEELEAELINALTEQDTTFVLDSYQELLKEYDEYFNDTLVGKHGKTPQFIAIYIHCIELYQLFERAMRTNDIDLFIYALHKMLPVFFSMNHHNYARWISRFSENLLNVNKTHPDVYKQLKNGALSVRRTAKNFSRNPVDLTIEQTINANAANKQTGIIAVTNNLPARQRWAMTHAGRVEIINNLLEFIGLSSEDDCIENNTKTKKFNERVSCFRNLIVETINPFDENLNSSHLVHLTTGKPSSTETSMFLLNMIPQGKQQMQNFIQKCHDPIKKNKICTFASENKKPKKSLVANNVKGIKEERNLLMSFLFMAMKREIDLDDIFRYPLTTVPYSLSEYDGTINMHNLKDDLLPVLGWKCNDELNTVDIEIIHGIDYIKTLTDVPLSFEKISLYILNELCRKNSLSEIHIIFNVTRRENQIINYHLERQNILYDAETPYKIHGPKQHRPYALSKLLNNSLFVNEFVNFLLDHWASYDIADILLHKRIVVSFQNKTYLFSKDTPQCKVVTNMENNHMEIETLVILHICKTIPSAAVLIKIQNIDHILVCILYQMQFMNAEKKIFIQTGSASNNSIKIINVRSIFNRISPTILNALPGWFAFIGCQYEPCFFGKGKKYSFKILEKDENIQEAFAQLGCSVELNAGILQQIERYTCLLYRSNEHSVNTARSAIFQSAYTNNVEKNSLQMDNLSKRGNI